MAVGIVAIVDNALLFAMCLLFLRARVNVSEVKL